MGCTKRKRKELPSMEVTAETAAGSETMWTSQPAPNRARGGRDRVRGSGTREQAAAQSQGARGRGRGCGQARASEPMEVSKDEEVSEDTTDEVMEGGDE
eukprot:1138608-Pelagomonas_calceolata.AAC.2